MPIDSEENVTFSHHIHTTWEEPFYATLYSPARGLGVAMRISELGPIWLHQKLCNMNSVHFTWAPLAALALEDILLGRKALELAGMLFGREEDDLSSICSVFLRSFGMSHGTLSNSRISCSCCEVIDIPLSDPLSPTSVASVTMEATDSKFVVDAAFRF